MHQSPAGLTWVGNSALNTPDSAVFVVWQGIALSVALLTAKADYRASLPVMLMFRHSIARHSALDEPGSTLSSHKYCRKTIEAFFRLLLCIVVQTITLPTTPKLVFVAIIGIQT